jgi:hypothetical protein
LKEERQPQVTGRFTGHVDAIEGVGIESVKKKLLGQRTARTGVGERDVWFERLAVREEQTEVGFLLTEVDTNLETIGHQYAPFKI